MGFLFINDVLETTIGAGSRAYHNPKLYLFTPSNYKPSVFRQNIYRMLKTGYLEKTIEKGEPVLKITRGGRQKIVRKFNYIDLQKRKWDGYWRREF